MIVTLLSRRGLRTQIALVFGMLAVGLAVAPADAHPLIAERVHWCTHAAGGRGAARELCDVLLAAQGKLDAAVAGFAR